MTDKQRDVLKDYVALENINHSGTTYQAGDTIQLTEHDALFLLKAKIVRESSDTDTVPPAEDSSDAAAVVKQQADEIARLQAENEQLRATQADTPPVNPETTNTDAANTESENAEPETPDYSSLKKAELSAELTKRGIEHDATAKNAELEALLVANDAAKQQAASQ